MSPAIEHEREHALPVKDRVVWPAGAKELAGAYARTFLATEDGQRVLRDLQLKFSHRRPRFASGEGADLAAAARIDGQCDVLREIEETIRIGTPSTWSQKLTL